MMKGAGSMMAVTVTLNKVRHDTRPAHHLNDTESVRPLRSFRSAGSWQKQAISPDERMRLPPDLPYRLTVPYSSLRTLGHHGTRRSR